MIYWRCKCGKVEAWESGMSPQPCEGCEACNTTLATHPDDHVEPIPHEFEPRFDSRTGDPKPRVCARCHATEKVPDEAHPDHPA